MPATYDPTSARVILSYVGDGRSISGVPARDLSENDVCRLAYERALAAVAQDVGRPVDPENPDAGVITKPDPRRPSQRLVRDIVDELLNLPVPAFRLAPKPEKEAEGVQPAEAPKPEKEA